MTKHDALRRRDDETPQRHRAFLLWCMQSCEGFTHGLLGRSKKATARAVRVSETTIKKWMETRDWARRCLAAGPGLEAERAAAELYRRLYLAEFGLEELPLIEHNVRVEMTAPPATEAQEEAAKVLVGMMEPEEIPEPPPVLKEAEVASELDKARARKLNETRALRSLSQGVIKEFGRLLREHKIKPSVQDLERVMTMTDKLDAEERRLKGLDTGQQGGGAAVESLRVRLAREDGRDVIEAVREDLEELLVAVEQIQASGAERERVASLRVVEGGRE